MPKGKVISDAIARKRLLKIGKKVRRDAKRGAKRGELSGESFELYLPVIHDKYAGLRTELSNGHANAIAQLTHRRAEILGQVEARVNTLGNDSHRLQQAYEAAQERAAGADVPTSEIPEDSKITIDPLRERLAKAKGDRNDGGAK